MSHWQNRTRYSTSTTHFNIKPQDMYYLVKLLLLHLRTWKSSASSSAWTTWLPSLKPRPLPTWTTTCWRTLLAKQVAMGLSKTNPEHEKSREITGEESWIRFARSRQCFMVCERTRQSVLGLEKPLHGLALMLWSCTSQNNKKMHLWFYRLLGRQTTVQYCAKVLGT